MRAPTFIVLLQERTSEHMQMGFSVGERDDRRPIVNLRGLGEQDEFVQEWSSQFVVDDSYRTERWLSQRWTSSVVSFHW